MDDFQPPVSKPDRLIKQEVESALSYDPELDWSRITVSCEGGVVTLAGAVPSEKERVRAGQDAGDVVGVRRVKNQVVVGASGEHLTDVALDERCRRAIDAEGSLIGAEISVTVTNGWVTLSGTVRNTLQRLEAEHLIAKVPGVLGVSVELSEKPAAAGDDPAGS